MIIFPAVDLKDGRCVRLKRGDMQSAMVYGDPAAMARKWEEEGASYLHVVDLNAAYDGGLVNMEAVADIRGAVRIPVQLGGGVRDMKDIDLRLGALSIDRVILGTAACEKPELVKEACVKYPGRVAVSIDASDGYAAVEGWSRKTKVLAYELGLMMRDAGVSVAVYTDISRDGMMSGPNLEETRKMIEKTGLYIIASGGVSSLADVKALRDMGAYGCIMGKSLYAGAVSLSDALKYEEEG